MDHIPAKVRLARAYIRHFPLALGKRWLWERLRWRSYTVRARTNHGTTLECHTGNGPDRRIYYFGVWEPNLTHWVRKSLGRGDVFIDVGAHIGYYTALAAKRVGSTGKVIALEASPSTYQILCQNVAVNDSDNVQAINAAAAAERGTVEVWSHFRDSARTRVWKRDGWVPGGEIEALPLHELVSDLDWSRTRLVKIDVEGYEPFVVAGLEPKLPYCRSDCEFLVELTPGHLQPGQLQKLLGTFATLGFHPYRLVNTYADDYYLFGRTDFAARRISHVDEITTATDVVFSRRSAEYLLPSH